MREPRIVCPECGQSDAIRKVSAIVAGGTSYTQSTRVGMSISGDDTDFSSGLGSNITRTSLASALASPQKPSAPFRNSFWAIFPGLRITCMVVILLLIVITTVCSFPFLLSTYRESPQLVFLPLLIFVVTAFLLTRWFVVSRHRESQQFRQAEASYPEQLIEWEHAYSRWERLYYCHRDDGVFIPAQTRLIPVNQMQAFLYLPDKKKR